MFISMFKVAIPGDIKRMMFSQAGGMPREDDEFLVVGEIKREESHGQKPEARREGPKTDSGKGQEGTERKAKGAVLGQEDSEAQKG